MHIKSIVIDGFKSYGKRTEVNNFDPEFNAITGLNGSGKSNILDSICFVLGITNLSQVRAGSLQELVYKSGQAGITKASVTVTFDNHDTSKSPLGYERYEEITITRQIVVGGKNKYMINGSTVQNKKVIDLFNSVQLNVNNPHFLIMQGRITKVLNMKPPEILAMIEEAAGTRMYENKKQAAERTIEKKDAKLGEMNKIICEEIAPKLGQLKDEQSKYLELQKVTRELDHLSKIYTAYRYLQAEEMAVKAKDDLVGLEKSIEDQKKNIEEGKAKIIKIESEITEFQLKRDAEKGGKLIEYEKKLSGVEGNQAKLVAKSKAFKDDIQTEERRKKHLEKSLKDDQDALSDKQKHLDKMKDVFEQLKKADQEDSEALAAAQRKYQAVSAGLIASDDGSESTYQDVLMKTKQLVAQAQTEKKQCKMQLDHNERELKTKEKQLKQTETDFAREQQQLVFKERESRDIQNELSKINYEDGQLERLSDEKRGLTTNVRMLQDKIANIESRNYRLAFRYSEPERNFNHSLVKGLVCKLIRVKDRKFCTALETAAGERLYNVIIENDEVGKKLLKYGELQSRTTFIPLNQIRGHSMDNRTINLAKQLVGNDNVFPALSLIEYDNKLHPAMEWVFGQVFICTDMDSCVKVAFDKRISKICITLDGDVVNPAGTLSGGAPTKSGSILAVVSELNKMQGELEENQEKLRRISAEIQGLTRVASSYADLKQKLELRKHEVEMIQKRLEQTTHHQYQQEVEELKKSIVDLNNKIEECSKIESENMKKITELEDKVKNTKTIRDKELKAAEAEMNRLNKKAETSRKQWKEREQECENLNLEVAELEKSIANGQEQIANAAKRLEELNQESKDTLEELAKIKDEIKALQSDIAAQKAIISKHDHEIHAHVQKKEKISKEVADAELACLSLELNITKMKSEADDAKKRLVDLENRYEWIKSDRQFFGEPNGMYDFKVHDPKEAGRKIKVLEETKEKLSRTVNTRAMNLLGKEEEHYNEMIRRKTIVENDKAKIAAVIKQLDEKKKEALRSAWKRVNREFGSIFSSLLPGAQAMLKPPDGKDLLDGLEVKVGFGGIWKDSLGELSGGQRSLVALSLILAMLLFNPAPIYILDEVDAALDLSHTQNIGQMLKAHFKHSQFIIVSLKDGMFNNANVLFRTRFVDGMSTVIRTTPDGH